MKPSASLLPPSLFRSLVLASAAWLAWAGPIRAADEPESKPATHKVASGTLHTEVTLDAVFESRTMEPIALKPEVWADLTVVDVVAHGTRVRKGDVLVRLEKDKLEEQIADLEAGEKTGQLSLEMAEAELENLEKTTPLKLDTARRDKYRSVEDYDYFVNTSRKMSEKSARFSLKSAEERLANAREELQQLEKMYKADDLTEETEEIVLQRQKFAVESAEFSLENAKLGTKRSLEVVIPRTFEDLKEQKVNQEFSYGMAEIAMPNTLEQKRLGLAKLKRDRKQATEKLADLRKDMEWATVRAPKDGVVYYGACDDGKWTTGAAVSKKLVAGGKLMPKEVIMTVVDPAALRLRTVVAEKDLANLKEGAKGEATPVAMPDGKLEVRIESIAMIPEPSGGFPARVSVDLPKDSRLVPGMNSKLRFKGERDSVGVLVPKEAVIKEGEETFVYVAGGEKPEKRAVKTGESDKTMTDVTEGLEADEEIFLKKPE